MKLINAINKLKTNGFILSQIENSPGFNKRFSASNLNNEILITSQGDEISTIRVRSVKEDDDINSDYFAGSYFDTMSKAINYAKK